VCFSSRKSSPPPAAASPPTPREISDFVNEITGTAFKKMTLPNGSTEYRTIRHPRPPKQQEFFNLAENMLSESLRSMKELFAYNPDSIPSYTPLINSLNALSAEQKADLEKVSSFEGFGKEVALFKELAAQKLEQEQYNERQLLEEQLARRGLSNSSIGASQRAALQAQQQLAKQQSEASSIIQAEEVARTKQENRLVGYHERQLARENEANIAQTQYNLAMQQDQLKEERRLQAVQEQQNLLNTSRGILQQDIDNALRGEQNALNLMNSHNQANLNAYTAGENAKAVNYQQQLEYQKSKAPSFGDFLLKTAGTGLGYAMGGPAGGVLMNHMLGGGGTPFQASSLPANYKGFGDFASHARTSTGLKPGRAYWS